MMIKLKTLIIEEIFLENPVFKDGGRLSNEGETSSGIAKTPGAFYSPKYNSTVPLNPTY
ncbi:MAG TPA: hypothetical protein PK728_08025 [Bacillota bacterium]|nr:hypothetical protein [Bacillota bacterium]